MARIGKIARVPEAVREELNRRLRGGQLGPQILPWLNAVPEVKAVCDEFFSGQSVNAQNLSDWRQGGYAEWEEKQDRHFQRLERIRELSTMSMKLAQANGGNLSEGAASILGGSILEVLEGIEGLQGAKGENTEGGAEAVKSAAEAIDNLTNAVARLRRGDHDKIILQQNEKRLEQKDKDLALAQASHDQRLREYQDKVQAQKREIESALSTARAGGLTPETLERIEAAAKLL